MTVQHKDRSHAQWSASATSRNVHCPGAIAMATIAPDDVESEAAAWGTACHQISEKCLRFKKYADSFIGETEKTERFSFVVDQEMADTAQTYIDYCQGLIDDYRDEFKKAPEFWVEQKFSLADLNPPFEAGGTGDFICYFPERKMIEIVDLKGGRGVVVEVKGNPQARTYALGALLAFPKLDVETVRSTIVQPRAPHEDGRIRSEDIHIADLVEWTHDLHKSMMQAKRANMEFDEIGGNSVKFDEWSEKWLKPGKCTFCPAEGFCPALKKQALGVAKAFHDDLDALQIGNKLPIESPEELAATLNGLDMLEDWINAVRSYAHQRAERGDKIPGWMLVDKIGNRAWIEKDNAKLAIELEATFHSARDELFAEPKIKSVAQIEKMLGKKRARELTALEGSLWEKPKRGTNLVQENKTTRPAAKSKPETHHEEV